MLFTLEKLGFCRPGYLYKIIHSSTAQNTLELEVHQISINTSMDKNDGICLYKVKPIHQHKGLNAATRSVVHLKNINFNERHKID